MGHMKRIGFLLTLLGYGLTVAPAAIHPDALRKRAPEILKLLVDEVRITKDESVDDEPGKIVIVAYVWEVTNSQTKLRVGDKILISYERYRKAEAQALKEYEARMSGGMTGAQFFHEPDIPVAGDYMMAYLNPDEDEDKRRAKIYHPGAQQYSFVVQESKKPDKRAASPAGKSGPTGWLPRLPAGQPLSAPRMAVVY